MTEKTLTSGCQETHLRPSGIAYLIGRLDHVLRRSIRDSLSAYGVTPSQYTALSIFRSQKPLSNAQLAERSMVSPQSANEMVKVMEARGWISRQSAQGHGRIIHIRLTDEGGRLLADCDRAVALLEKNMLADLGTAECAAMQRGLRSMIHSLSVPPLHEDGA